MNVNRYKHASDVLHSSASMSSFRAFGHVILYLLQEKKYRQTVISIP
jgi:hypothetical protein